MNAELWIGAADVKDVYVKKGWKEVPLLGMLASQLARGVDVRLIHAKEFWPAFREDFDKSPITVASLHRGRQSHGSGAGHEKCTAPQL